jgi:ubiquinone/menaquinone biosynthesis C-methylase UbiE
MRFLITICTIHIAGVGMPDIEEETPGTRYERELVPAMFMPFARDLVERIEFRDNMQVIDIACGTGIVTRLIGAKLDATSTVTGTDINTAMLDVARANSTGYSCKVEWREASAEAQPFNDASADLLVCQLSFMLFPDKPAAAREMHRVLRSGGYLYVSAWRHYSRQPHYKAFIEGLDHFVSAEASNLMKSAFQFETEDSICGPISEGGFQDVYVETVAMDVRFPSSSHFVRTVVGGSILARMGIDISEEILDQLCVHVSNALVDYETAQELRVPMEAYLARSVR